MKASKIAQITQNNVPRLDRITAKAVLKGFPLRQKAHMEAACDNVAMVLAHEAPIKDKMTAVKMVTVMAEFNRRLMMPEETSPASAEITVTFVDETGGDNEDLYTQELPHGTFGTSGSSEAGPDDPALQGGAHQEASQCPPAGPESD